MNNPTLTEKDFSVKLKEKGLKPTHARVLVFDEVLKMKHHFSADDLAFQVRQKDQNVSRATVYRTMPLLIEFGILREVVFSDKHHNYECMVGRKHHEHLICLKCGGIIEFSDERMEEPLKAACQKFGFMGIAHKTEVTGYCAKCRKESNIKN